MSDRIHSQVLSNGLTIVAEEMPWLESAAMTVVLPAGCVWDPADRLGLANLTCEMAERGAGNRSSREFLEALEFLGADWSSSVSAAHTSFGAAMPADRLADVLPLFADLTRRPSLPPEQLEEARLSCLQELRALEDDLAQRVMSTLREKFYPSPWGRQAEGTAESLQAATHEDVRGFFQTRYHAKEAIIGIAGKVDWPAVAAEISELWGDWNGGPAESVEESEPPYGYTHLEHDSAQTHIGIACPSVPFRDPDFYQARGAVGVLSDGMSSRLFTEVREKRGLVYTVSASCHTLRHRGGVFCYAGTTPDRAQETLDVVLTELKRLNEGVEQAELDRLKARIKSVLIMQQESSRNRCSQIVGSWYHLGRVQSLDEVREKIDHLTCDSINDYLRRHPLRDFTIVTLGPQPLEVPSEL